MEQKNRAEQKRLSQEVSNRPQVEMININREFRITVKNTLIQGAIIDDGPIVFTFAPAGTSLTTREVGNGELPWGFKFLSSRRVNVVSFNPISTDHKYEEMELFEWAKSNSYLFQHHKERLAYGVSMGAYGALLLSHDLMIDRALLFSPTLYSLTPTEHNMHVTVVYDPFCGYDKKQALSLLPSSELHTYGVGHRGIESISACGYLSPLIRAFIDNQIVDEEFYLAMRGRKSTERYYTYMKRNPTGKNTKSRRRVITTAWLKWNLSNPKKVLNKLYKSARKRLLAVSVSRNG
ncbi:MAG: hypothetical protein V7735_25545 [Photobacterium frigidiphilum]|uniref:hypothetical protein n=1 Tax=Photobacterium frigidiphilum TaxID=264736 RepID=UPI0030016CBD